MNVTAVRIRRALEEAMAALEQLAGLLADERRLLGQRRPAQLERLAVDKQAVAAALEHADTARQRALQEAGYKLPDEAMEQFLRLEGASELAALWQGFLTQLREVRARNEANGLAIRRSQVFISAELSLLYGQPVSADEMLYDAAGGRGHRARGRIISSA
ncbi:MAG TPA: flagellar protein FlgN [Nitrococcus sp.]|nr:flagellar protein FlgN [Nitrococcus sp.]